MTKDQLTEMVVKAIKEVGPKTHPDTWDLLNTLLALDAQRREMIEEHQTTLDQVTYLQTVGTEQVQKMRALQAENARLKRIILREYE